MKKGLLKFMLAAVAVIAISVSCDKDEFNASDLVGDWELTHEEYVYKANGQVVDEESYDVTGEGNGITFYKDGSCDVYDYSDVDSGTWSLSGSTLKLTYGYDEYDGDYAKFTVNELTSSKLVLSASDKYTEDGVSYHDYVKLTFRKK